MKKRFSKKAVSIILSTLMLLNCTVFAVNAAVLDKDSNLVSCSASLDCIATASSIADECPDAYNAIVEGMKNMDTEINLRGMNVPYDSGSMTIKLLFTAALDDNPMFFYVDTAFRFSVSGGYITNLLVTYTYDSETVARMTDELNSTVSKYLSLVSDDIEDYEKALVLHDAIALNCEYDLTYGAEHQNAYNIYGALCDGIAVCQGYAYAYEYLLSCVGIEASIVTSESMTHAWNLVKIGDDYYHVDVTWDDPIYDKTGRVEHRYFLLSDEYIQTTEGEKKTHHDYESQHEALSNKYDGYFWSSISSKFNYINNAFYYADLQGNIIKRSGFEESDSEEVIFTVTDKWVYSAPNAYYRDKFVKAEIYDGYIYYNTPDAVYKMSLDATNSQLVYENTDETQHIFGIAIKSDGIMYGSLISDYNGVDNVIKIMDMSQERPEPTTEPITTEPVTTEPITTVPVTTAPITTVPITTVPVTTAPITTVPVTTVPVTTAPITTIPVTTAPITTVPITTEPITTQPITTQPITTQPLTDPIIVVLGDVNGDSEINIKDATVVQLYIASRITLEDKFLSAADVTRDGKVNVKDVTTIQKFIAEIITEF